MNLFTQLCPDSNPNLFNFFDTSIAPRLLFYSYIPILLLVIFFGIYVFVLNKKSLQSKLFLGITLSFAIWIFAILFQWIAAYANVVHFAWQFLAFPEIFIYIFSFYFVYVFLNKEDLPFWVKIILSLLIIPIFVLVPSKYNVASFDLANCQGNLGVLWNYIYTIEPALIVLTGFFCIDKYFVFKNKDEKTQSLLLAFGMVSFLGFFYLSNLLGEILQSYSINLFGPLGMVIFLGLLSYMIVRFRTFNIKLIGAQVLIVSLIILIGSQFFFIQTNTTKILASITLVFTGLIGINLIRSVKKEVEQREKIEKLAQGQASLIHFMNHQIKGRFGNIRNIFAELQTDDYGTMPPATIPLIQKGADEAIIGVNYVTGILKGASAENGTLQYEMKPLDFKSIVEEVSAKQKEYAEKKGLKFSLNIDGGDYIISADSIQLVEAVKNLIDNSINYTPSGSVSVNLSQNAGKVLLKVSDTGVGITPEDRARLFTAGGRGVDSLKVNINATGYGLVFVKNVAMAHKGRVWVESDGSGKGSTFYLELPKR